ncbi:MAG TPA: nicotinate-nucleotide--dimethylbenzimidazole phosphoribosyltransferase [Polyangiales bacterium]|jgi:nicotinate-nucleotide--dimethylbenzimidazole phosphoribosyltransferase|nr:nicotinate-nucleotide--dimethylbenzimidazole phosphoribosyltransferase [Polyangiales bacterium]
MNQLKNLQALCACVEPTDRRMAELTQKRLDGKTKPRGSLGRLEEIACQLAAIQRTESPSVAEKAIVVMGADHGVAVEGVSAYPQEVTAQMLLNFARGGAGINVLARHAGARVQVVDIGVAHPLPPMPEITSRRIREGTANFTQGPAMTPDEAIRALLAGSEIASKLVDEGVQLIGIGEMGIANTTASSAITAVLTRSNVEEVTGLGTGIDVATRSRKVSVIQRAIAKNTPDPKDPLDVLHKLGGLEIAGLAGVVLGAAARRTAVVIDGFISSTAALIAARLSPNAAGYLFASHRSVEVGHRMVLVELGRMPLLDLGLRLGEGTGAALAMNLIEASVRVLSEMATFESAGVTDAGR